ncbi:MAG: PTS system mannose/fructose/sorbose family transporter subunit IID [Candidatus Delongbacteria bacterium]|jgi:mannose/fructose/N-acetylgalactosamine-specific phosphotransferase system component IID|nr:PTS system mannose/fructose/sorbose family transporter subunit IID [Candidatus Delongbacteria bacterium]
MRILTKKEIFILTVRTFLIRTLYNYKNLFGIGLCYCLLPVGKKSFNPDLKTEEFLKRHISFFNTNVYLSGFAVGITIHMESSGKSEKLVQVKNTLSGTLGALGDNLINKTILPLMIFSSLNFFVIHKFELNLFTIFFNLFLLTIFNIFNFSIRYYGISRGHKVGSKSLDLFKSKSYKSIMKILSFTRDLLAAFLIINLITLLNLPKSNHVYLLNLSFSMLLFFYLTKFFQITLREIAIILAVLFYLIVHIYYF